MKVCVCDNFRDVPSDFQAVLARCKHAPEIASTLDSIARDPINWTLVERCRVCGALWAREFTFANHHGGGWPCLYRITTDDPVAWLQHHVILSTRLRSEHEEAEFLAALGSESGPEPCRHLGCSHLRIAYSVFCQAHHAASLKALRR